MGPSTSHNKVDPITPEKPKTKQTAGYKFTQILQRIIEIEEQGDGYFVVTAHFMLKRGSYKNAIPLATHVPITLPYDIIIKSTNTCELNLPHITEEFRLEYIVFNPQKHSPISIWQICAAQYQVLFTDIK